MIGGPILQLCDPEVHQPHVDGRSLDQHDVLRLDVAVHHAPLVGVLQGAAQLDAGFQDLGIAQSLVPIVLAKGVALDVLGEEQRPLGLADHLVNGEDVVVAELGRRLGLPQHPVVDVDGLLHDLDGDRPPHVQVVGQIHGGERPTAQLADDPVAIVEERRVGHGPSISSGLR